MIPDTSTRTCSEDLLRKASKLIPGGVNSPARAFGAVGGTPPFMERGDGAYLFDVDGNRFIDFIGSWGPHLFGHRHPTILTAIEHALTIGTSFGAPTAAEYELARLVVEMVPSIEMVRTSRRVSESRAPQIGNPESDEEQHAPTPLEPWVASFDEPATTDLWAAPQPSNFRERLPTLRHSLS